MSSLSSPVLDFEPPEALHRLLGPPVFPGDAARTRHAHLLNIVWLAFLGTAVAALVGGTVGTLNPWAQWFHLFALLACVPLRWALVRGHFEAFAVASLAIGWATITILLVLVGTVRTPALGFLIVLVNAAGVMLGFRAMVGMIVLHAATVAVLIVAQTEGVLPRAEVNAGFMQWVVSVAVDCAAGGLTYACLRHTQGSLGRAEEEIVERRRMEAELARKNAELALALEQVKTLTGLLPVCGWCRKVRSDDGYWDQLESFVSARTDATFTHDICPDCRHEHFPRSDGQPRR